MERFSARAFYLMGFALATIQVIIAEEMEATDFPILSIDYTASEKLLKRVAEQLTHVETFCQSIELDLSAKHALRLVEKLKGEITPRQIGGEVAQLKQRISDEMQGKLFMYIPSRQAKFYGLDEPFGPEVAKKFPSALPDSREAANCYAAGRWTACVFHLMRVLESGLAALGTVFSVSLKHTNWAPAIDQIESKVRDMHKDPTWKALPDCKEQQQFYAQAASFLGVVKDAWRNYTAHAHGVYTQEEAELMLLNVRSFMEKISQRMGD
jgi:hypothetical protein